MTTFRRLNECPLLQLQECFLDSAEAEHCYHQLRTEHQWPDNHYEVFGRSFSLPRQQTWHADEGIVYSYSNNLLQTRPWSPLLLALRVKVEAATGLPFNAVLVNLYRHGKDYVGWHSDDEIEMGEEPFIASLSLGTARAFSYRQKIIDEAQPQQGHVVLPSGSLLLMEAAFQHHWEHSVLPSDTTDGRINLTFRNVLPLKG